MAPGREEHALHGKRRHDLHRSGLHDGIGRQRLVLEQRFPGC